MTLGRLCFNARNARLNVRVASATIEIKVNSVVADATRTFFQLSRALKHTAKLKMSLCDKEIVEFIFYEKAIYQLTANNE